MKKMSLALMLSVILLVPSFVFSQSESVPNKPTFSATYKPTDSSPKCEVSATGETGIYSSYLEGETGETYHDHPVSQSELNIEVCANRRNSYGANFWNSLSTKKNPSSGTEFDAMLFFNSKLTKDGSVNLHGDAAVFFLEKSQKIYKVNLTLSKDFKFTDTVDGTLSNSTSYYWSSDKISIPGGVVNTVALDISKQFKRNTLTITPAISVDNNLFSLGVGRVAGIAHLDARYDIPINPRITFFVSGRITSPIFGDTDRRFRKAVGFGFSFRLK